MDKLFHNNTGAKMERPHIKPVVIKEKPILYLDRGTSKVTSKPVVGSVDVSRKT